MSAASFRCAKCGRFTSRNRVTFNVESIVDERGDCSRCGPQVPIDGGAWEDWFPDGGDHEMDRLLDNR